MFAHDFIANVLDRGTQFIPAVRALSVEGLDDDQRRVRKRLVAVLSLDLQVAVLRMNPQFLTTTWATDIMTFRRRSSYHGKLRQGYERRNLDAVFCELRIQQCATGPTMHDAWRHVIATLRTGTSWPGTIHRNCLLQITESLRLWSAKCPTLNFDETDLNVRQVLLSLVSCGIF